MDEKKSPFSFRAKSIIFWQNALKFLKENKNKNTQIQTTGKHNQQSRNFSELAICWPDTPNTGHTECPSSEINKVKDKKLGYYECFSQN